MIIKDMLYDFKQMHDSKSEEVMLTWKKFFRVLGNVEEEG